MNSISIHEVTRNNVVHFQARIHVNGRFYSFSSMSEAGVRTWLARQGIPFTKQPELVQGG